jgi:hypothetical protein
MAVCSETIFWFDHLDLESLREIGKLTIRWIAYVDKHLLQEAENSTLWVYRKRY